MTEQSVKRIEWACRLLMTFDLILIAVGYIGYFQVKYQLVSPLIPKSTFYQILEDNHDATMKACLVTAGVFMIGTWFYSFNKKMVALILFALAAISFKAVQVI